MELLTRLEEAILIAVLRLESEAYGVAINRELSRILEKDFTLGAFYFVLNQLVRKQYLGRRAGESTPQRGGRSKTYYRITPEGKQALAAIRAHQAHLWKQVPGFGHGEGR
jgi:DNA-binding PadR family transcriptional regulator